MLALFLRRCSLTPWEHEEARPNRTASHHAGCLNLHNSIMSLESPVQGDERTDQRVGHRQMGKLGIAFQLLE
jgi:hypothetical protein